MVSVASIAAMILTLCICLFLPVILLIVYAVTHRKKKVVSAWFLGAAGFSVTQILIRTPILTVLGLLPDFQDFVMAHYVAYVLILAFTAGLFEVAGRYVVAKLLRKELTFERGLAAGLGHGGIEAMILIGITYINNLVYAVMINTGTFDIIVEQTAALGVDTAGLLTLKDTFLTTPAYIFCLAGYERILTMISHTAMSLIVCYYVTQKQDLKGVLICLAFHTLLDGVSGLVNGMSTEYMGNLLTQNTVYILIYIFLTAMAVISAVVIFRLSKVRKTMETT
ncbi:MAG: YhfC family intramembrane metalloprotease [Lachnospiraceae bacterium]|nr:YhfC family intramembrane metalloprotease [Lachnospiraceae bacterium]